MKNWFAGLLLLFWGHLVGCSQNPPPPDLPQVQNPAFQKKLSSLLHFSTPLIGVVELNEKMQTQNWVVLDAREREEYEVSHLPGAHFAGYSDFDPSEWSKLPKDQPIAVYCSVGYRSEKITAKLQKQGFTQVFNLYGSIFEWANRDFPLVDAKEDPTNRVHTYNKDWSRWVDNEKIVKIW